jgi:hypothetical protein
MAFVVSEGSVRALERAPGPRSMSVQVSADFTQDYAEIWRTQPQVRTVVGFLGRNIAQLGLHVFERISDNDRRRLADHPMAQLIAKPNPRTSRYRMIDALVNDLGIYDCAYWLKARAIGQDNAVLRLPPGQTTPVGDSWLWPDTYRFRGQRGYRDFDASDIVHFRGYNPTDARTGVSPMETLRRILAEEYEAGNYREQLWRNGARFPGHIRRPLGAPNGQTSRRSGSATTGAAYTPATARRRRHTRPRGRHDVRSERRNPRAGAVPRDPEADPRRGRIGVPHSAADGRNPRPRDIQQHQGAAQAALPGHPRPLADDDLRRIGAATAARLDPNPNIYIEFNMAEKLKGSFEEQASQMQTAVGAPWLTRNEARARQNLPQIAGGDELVTPLNVLIGGQASPTDSAPKSSGVRSKGRAPDTYRAKHEQVVSGFFKRQAAVVKTALGVKAADEWWDQARWDKELADDLAKLGVSTSTEVAKSTLDSLGLDETSYSTERTVAFLSTVATRIAAAVNAATKDQLDAALASDDPSMSVNGVFDIAASSRAAQIAKTAVTAWSGFGTVEAAKQSTGDRAEKTWVTGHNPRPSHARMNGETVAIDATFSNGLQWPGDGSDADEIAGCNCGVEITIP